MPERVQVFEGAPAEERLAELGLPLGVLLEALDYGAAEMAMCTEFDAPSYRGSTMYSRTGRRLRESLPREEWDGGVVDGQMRIWNRHREIQILHALGDELTGDPRADAVPSQKHPKGPATERAVGSNQVQVIEPGLFDLDELQEVKPEAEGIQTWILLYRVDEDRILAELSRPALIAGGLVVAWEERIVLPEIDRGGEIVLDDPADLPADGIGVEIRRRA